jgi:amidase
MTRRKFIQSSVVGAVAATGASACSTVSGATDAHGAAEPFELAEWSIARLQTAMEAGELTARAVAELYIERIAALDRQGPTLRSVIEINPDALDIADQLDRERRAGGARGPLHGIPVLVKDNIGTADAMTTTAGSLALQGCIAPRDAFVAKRLRQAGAVLLAKTNMSEWANFRSMRSTSGWSARGGLCRNPYVLDRNPCGSSSGSAVATSGNLGAVSVGTETDGSIVFPASINGVVGLKPTVGLVSRAGIIPIAHSQDTAGPMARTVADAAVLLGALAGADRNDAATAAAKSRAKRDYAQYLDRKGLAGARIGVARQFFGFNRHVDRLMEQAVEQMRRERAVIVDPVTLAHTAELNHVELVVLLHEFKHGLDRYLAGLGAAAPHHSLTEIIAFNDNNAETEMPYFGQDLFLKAAEMGPLSGEIYKEALALMHRLSRDEGIDKVLREHRLDALIAPTGNPAWPTDLVNGDHMVGFCSSFAAAAGYPHISVPAGDVHGLPVGISFFAGAWSEPTLLKLAFAFEQATTLRREPHFRPTLDLG